MAENNATRRPSRSLHSRRS